VCKALAHAGYRPVTYDNLSLGHADAVRWGPLEVGDLGDQARLTRVLRRYRPAAVIHLAGLSSVAESVREPALYHTANVAGSISLCAAMRATDVKVMVFSSSAAVYGVPAVLPIAEDTPAAPINPYGRTKLMVEQLLADCGRAYGLKWTALRYFNAAGSDPEGEIGERHAQETHLVPLTLDAAMGGRDVLSLFGDDYPTPDGTCVRDYVHVSDLADAHVKALDYLISGGESGPLNLGVGKGASVAEIIAATARVTGQPVPFVRRPRRAGDPPVLVSDPRRAQRVLGWQPRYPSIEDAILHAFRFRYPASAGVAPVETAPIVPPSLTLAPRRRAVNQ
jgi:UDP-arabinose 4-epimerase